MKSSSSAELCCRVIHGRTIMPLKNVALYQVEFENGRFAVLRINNLLMLQEGDIISRVNEVWSAGPDIIQLSPFEFLDQGESQRYFTEYER
ncbi:hypothetical protein [Pantoea agglomerans]|uniref:hypothetical protein n=1 Tax=Enterobacter agglomerans TaxID=549 RepID=UPI001F0821EA|nr:hypothetical protein [Pantoea agglomerans]